MTQDLDALPLPSFVKTSPERIYLVLGDFLEEGDKFSDLDEVTWCEDKQYDTDIEYVRADVVREIVAAELRKAQEAEHAAPHAGVYQGLTDHIVGLIREDRKAQEGREPVGKVWFVVTGETHEGQETYTRHEEFVPFADAECLYTSPPPKSDEARDAERLNYIEKNARCDPKMDGQHVWWPTNFNHALKGPTLRSAIDAALAAKQSKGEAS